VTGLRRWVPAILMLVALGLLPWTLWLTLALPSRHVAEHWDLAWGGFDVFLSASLVTTAPALVRRHRLVQGAAAASGALLLADAWFDSATAGPGRDFTTAIVLAAACELPLAALCFWIAKDTEQLYAAATWLRRLPGFGRSRAEPARPSRHG